MHGANNPFQFGLVPLRASVMSDTIFVFSDFHSNWQAPRITFKKPGEFLAPGIIENYYFYTHKNIYYVFNYDFVCQVGYNCES